jgi:hypothetical protein
MQAGENSLPTSLVRWEMPAVGAVALITALGQFLIGLFVFWRQNDSLGRRRLLPRLRPLERLV